MITPSSPQGDLPQGFLTDANGARWIYIGELTFANASNVYGAALTLPLPQSGEVDLSGMAAVDSSAVAVLRGSMTTIFVPRSRRAVSMRW